MTCFDKETKYMTDKKLIALADSFMAIFGYKRIATIKDNVITPARFEEEDARSENDRSDDR